MTEIAKMLIFAGLGLALLGFILYFSGKIPGFGKLPGDLLIKKENFTLYFPITTCILISAALSLILFLWNQKK
ncbi:MAG: DUF2905 domain-containing protein [Candidatus Omnitrophica bacterium]|nr:DUF2905 domain-containing protein [Candidatus Omnitrophota bacterium]